MKTSVCQGESNGKQVPFAVQNFRKAFELEVLITAEGESGNEYIDGVCKRN